MDTRQSNKRALLKQVSLRILGGQPYVALNPLLCEHCQQWDILRIFHAIYGRDEGRSLEEISQNVDCILCRAIAEAVHTRCHSGFLQTHSVAEITVRNHGPYFLHKMDQPSDFEKLIDTSHPGYQILNIVMELHVDLRQGASYGKPMPLDVSGEGFFMTPQLSLYYSKNKPHKLMRIQSWEVPFFDVSLLRTWLRGCEVLHGSECLSSHDTTNQLPPEFRLIDVHTRSIVKPGRRVRFVSLSYMWQQTEEESHVQLQVENITRLEAPGGLDSVKLPHIISDSISLCRELGEKYLWVDRLCIIQDVVHSKQTQINAMDQIYRSADFTIIAALNDRDGNGLPGSNRLPRVSSVFRPPRAHRANGEFMPTGMNDIVNTSLWDKRGWTFQERVLSRRRVFITDHEAIFECSQGYANEELTHHLQSFGKTSAFSETKWQKYFHQYRILTSVKGLFPKLSNTRNSRIQFLKDRLLPAFTRSNYGRYIDYTIGRHTNLVNLFHWVRYYSSRQFSDESDILNAFTGVGNQIGKILDSNMVFGLPERYLPQAMMWSCFGLSEPRTRALDIPSWSWASSRSQSEYEWLMDIGHDPSNKYCKNVLSLVKFYIHDSIHKIQKLEVEERWMSQVISIENLAKQENLPDLRKQSEYSEMKSVPDTLKNNEIWRQCPQNPWETALHQTLEPEIIKASRPGALIFNTTVASLQLCHNSPRTQTTAIDGSNVAICLPNKEIIGWINKMSLEWIEKMVGDGKTHEIIVIAGALTPWRIRNDWDTAWRLHVLLVEILQLEPYVVRRIDAGYVYTNKWKECNPRWETVVLQ